VYGTHGAGETLPSVPTMMGTVVVPVGSVQYAKLLEKLTVPCGLK
jgi:hypothetical protein